MLKIKYFLFFFILKINNAKDDRILKIIGGEYAGRDTFPFIASIRIYTKHLCGGSIISNRFILTAAHCIYRMTNDEFENCDMVAGTNYLQTGGTYYKPDLLIFPSTYSILTQTFDVGLIRTKTTIVFTNVVHPIALERVFIPNNINATLIGWGRNSTYGTASEVLKKLNVTTRMDNCYFINVVINPFMHLGAYKDQHQGACFGDSGSPLISNNKQIGIFSFMSSPCARGVCDVYTRISSCWKWIEENVLKYSS